MAGDKKAYALRLDPQLFAAIERAAAADLRSVNAEIEFLLREALARRGVKVAASEPAKRGRPPKTGGEGAAGEG
ncbi:MAG: toxin-antitoxin system HicB family antitoxin [Alphaproteobacteria bacterium]|nr:toxin-antitoxin system HicB family antitoxin [Alphaproteobacteria bacterium]